MLRNCALHAVPARFTFAPVWMSVRVTICGKCLHGYSPRILAASTHVSVKQALVFEFFGRYWLAFSVTHQIADALNAMLYCEHISLFTFTCESAQKKRCGVWFQGKRWKKWDFFSVISVTCHKAAYRLWLMTCFLLAAFVAKCSKFLWSFGCNMFSIPCLYYFLQWGTMQVQLLSDVYTRLFIISWPL